MNDHIHLLNHPVLQHKISLLRNKNTPPSDFRKRVAEVALFLGIEATRDFETKQEAVQTPLAMTSSPVLTRDVCLIPVLRAGLGMVDGLLALFPKAVIGHIGLYRNEESLNPEEYYCKLPQAICEQHVLILDPMIATGGSASAAITLLKKRGVRHIKMLNIIGAPEGIATITREHPDVHVYLGALDPSLNAQGYILPGLGDAGDRIFGTLA